MAWNIELFNNVPIVTIPSVKAGAQGEDFYLDLRETLDIVEEEYPPRPVILRGEGRVFSAGLDLRYVHGMFVDGNHEEILAWQRRYFESNIRLFSFNRPLIAAINGHAYAGGLITALCADWRIAVREARFALNEVSIGIPMPRVYLELISFSVGLQACSRLSLFGEELNAGQAESMGLIHEVADDLMDQALARANSIDDRTLEAYLQTKRGMRNPVIHRMREFAYGADDAIVKILASSNSTEALEARIKATLSKSKRALR
ncbi:enoyl-CoA hydratase/isomerase family protein [Streptomyces sp. NPDC002306]